MKKLFCAGNKYGEKAAALLSWISAGREEEAL